MWGLVAILLLLVVAVLLVGSVAISPAEVWRALVYGGDDPAAVIIRYSRLPTAVSALLAGPALAIAGLQMQTTFDNPLAGPSILGVSSGASLGVAVALLGFGGSLAAGMGMALTAIIGAFAGAALIILLLLAFSRLVVSSTMLLIVGIIIGYLTSSLISLLNFFATQEGVHSFVIWGLGSFGGMTPDRLSLFVPLVCFFIAASFLMVKPLDALQLGDNYASNLGVNVRRARGLLLFVSGALTAIITAYCGPIAFVGLIVPHIARLLTRTASHLPLMLATALCGAIVTLLCQLLSVLPASGTIPVNAITPLIGAPVILYVIVNRRKIFYLR
ncbi:MAG: iron ABC transporter permease [Candidatus Amulumruptor caecigallinarius]|nr:iron ABC transporter permease [Candidatus Amulumruptor caecigallinarius]MCM1396901.1 iron ABC transporter permease [Candidatus Amulumruptor caecigallinarius]MCM1454155.1 iron ABC transporter permease [bacterium]